jgi:hypothetical protein
MWTFIGIVVVILICAGIAASSNQAEVEQKKLLASSAAKRPEAFQRLFAEEFPAFSSNVTYSKAEAILSTWTKAAESWDFKQHVTFFGGQFKDSDHHLLACKLMVARTASLISDEFASEAAKAPIDYYSTMHRIITSANTLSGGS